MGAKGRDPCQRRKRDDSTVRYGFDTEEGVSLGSESENLATPILATLNFVLPDVSFFSPPLSGPTHCVPGHLLPFSPPALSAPRPAHLHPPLFHQVQSIFSIPDCSAFSGPIPDRTKL